MFLIEFCIKLVIKSTSVDFNFFRPFLRAFGKMNKWYLVYSVFESYTVCSDRMGTFQKQEMEEGTMIIPSR